MSHYTLSKYISRLMAVLLAFMLLLGSVPAALADGESGSCGSGLNWSLEAGVLTITGSGDMTDYTENNMAPWYPYRENITKLVLPEGLTSVGKLAFYDCSNLKIVDLPDAVRSIGEFAFASCEKIELLDLGSGLETIGNSAFYGCSGFKSVRLPQSLKRIGKEAFYSCTKLEMITVPAAVTSIGSAAFAYCTSMVRAEIQSPLKALPDWLFFGCWQMSAVILPETVAEMGNAVFRDCDVLRFISYGGKNISKEELENSVVQDVPGFSNTGYITDNRPNDIITSTDEVVKEDGSISVLDTTITEGENSTVSSTIDTNLGKEETTISADIVVTIDKDTGWEEATDAVDEALKNHNQYISNDEVTAGDVNITVYVKDSESIDQKFIENLAGQNVTVTIITQEGHQWQFKGTELDGESESESYDLRYEVSPGSAELCEELGTDRCFVLKFLAPATINAEVMIRLDPALSLQNGTLLQRDKELTKIQSSVIDYEGYAHFYLASVSNEIEYYIAMNLPEAQQEAIIPEAVQAAYGNPEFVEPIKYEITGRTSSWGMTINQVTWIMIAVLVGCVIIVGIVMFSLNKRKLKKGYIPDLEDEEY